MSLRKYHIDPYDRVLLVLDGETGLDDTRAIEAVEEAIGKKLSDKNLRDLSARDAQAITFKFKGVIGVRFIDPDIAERPSLAAHEAFHVACFVMRYAGVRLTKSSEEAFAYLLSHVFEKLMEGSDA